MTVKTKKQDAKAYHHGDLRNALIQSGLELLAEGGASGLDLRQVARRAGVSHAAPYRHFSDKSSLLAAINQEGFRWLAESIQTRLATAPNDALEQLVAIANGYVQFAQAHPRLMREMFSGLNIEREGYPELYAESKSVYELYVQVVRRGQERGQIIGSPPTALAGVLWSMLHGVAMLIIEHQITSYADTPEAIESVTRLCVESLYKGLGVKD